MSPILNEAIESVFAGRETAVARDLKLNLKKVLESGALDATESALALVATATSVGLTRLADAAAESLRAEGVNEESLREARESAAIMGMLNVYYRFRHLLGDEQNYQNTGLRMTALARPAVGKARFEMLAFAVSVLNGCGKCITAHEKALRDAQVSVEKIHDLARLAAIVAGVQTLSAIAA